MTGKVSAQSREGSRYGRTLIVQLHPFRFADRGSNATGDQIVTGGKMSVVQLATAKKPADGQIFLKRR
jgi:hypothetical protein